MDAHISYHEAQLLVDEEIADLTTRMQHSIRLLKTRRNDLAPVSKLPDEILLHIFLIFRDSTDLHPRDWHQVTHICRYWRDVAIGSPSLWTRLYNPPHAFALLLLKRSEKAPLEIHFSGFPSERFAPTLNIVLPEIERIHTMTFQHMPSTLVDTAQTILATLGQQEASMLEALTINVYSSGPVLAAFKFHVFRSTRLLRKLFLAGLQYEWSILPLPNLTYLNLSGEISGDVSDAQFTEALRQMPKLESLRLDWSAIHLGQNTDATHSQPIHLPGLKTLDIYNCRQDDMEWLLPQMTHPRLQQLELDSNLPFSSNIEMCRLVKSSIEKGDFGSVEFKFLTIDFEYFTASACPEATKYNGAFVEIYVPVGGDELIFETELEAVSNVLSCIMPFNSNNRLLPLRHLSLQDFSLEVDEFIDLFAYLPHLETIEVYPNIATVLWKCLATTLMSDDATTNTSAFIPFPKLQSIIWHGRHKHRHRIPILSSTAFGDLYRSVLYRHAQGAAITKLEMVACERLDEFQANQLKEIGVEVIVRKS